MLALMLASGIIANRTLAAMQTHSGQASLVDATVPQVTLPGIAYVSQNGAVYAISGSNVRRLGLPAGGAWIQPRLLPDGTLLVVRRFDAYSDLYHVTSSGHVLAQLTRDDQSNGLESALQLDHWALWPAPSADSATVYFATDSPKPAPGQGYEVDFTLWSAPLGGSFSIGGNAVTGGTQWSTPDLYTGGDIEPVPLPDGDVLYSSYANSGNGAIVSVLGLQTAPNGPMQQLTPLTESCTAPAVASDGVTVAMVCTSHGSTDLEVAQLNGTTLSTPRVVVAGCLCNSPSWSQHGDGLLYMNAADANGNFGLWYIANGATAHPAAPLRVTAASVDLDATSAAAWSG
ncbi:MAG: hypothetical protein JO247_21435 [Chloroflexi bacterium]|nr:hypothetical protein [Chloroflexota bacterium]